MLIWALLAQVPPVIATTLILFFLKFPYMYLQALKVHMSWHRVFSLYSFYPLLPMNSSLVLYPANAMGETPFIFEDAVSSHKSLGSGSFCYSCFLSLECQAESGEHNVFPLFHLYQEGLLSSQSLMRAKS